MPTVFETTQKVLREGSDEIPVKLPNLFQTFLKTAPAINPHYRSVREESEQWLHKLVASADITRENRLMGK